MSKIKVSVYNDDEHGRDIAVIICRAAGSIESFIVEPETQGRANNLLTVEINKSDLVIVRAGGADG